MIGHICDDLGRVFLVKHAVTEEPLSFLLDVWLLLIRLTQNSGFAEDWGQRTCGDVASAAVLCAITSL